MLLPIIKNSCQPHATDNGEAVETRSALPRVISYIPYGEIFVEQQSGGWQSPYLFNSKELDEETGLYYYGARYLDPTHAMWMSVDPLWEKNIAASPYNYCHGNPIMMVDPNGLDDYCVDSEGYVKKINVSDSNPKVHTLWAVDEKGNRTRTNLKVKNKSILEDLTKNRTDYEGHYTLSKSSEIVSVFSFLADVSTKAEWGLEQYSDKSYSMYTTHKEASVKIYSGNKNKFNTIISIHSHPGTGFEGTKGGSGWMGPRQLTGDMANINKLYRSWVNKYGIDSREIWSFTKHFVYHRASKHLYQYTPWEWSIDLGEVYDNTLTNNLNKAKSPLYYNKK